MDDSQSDLFIENPEGTGYHEWRRPKLLNPSIVFIYLFTLKNNYLDNNVDFVTNAKFLILNEKCVKHFLCLIRCFISNMRCGALRYVI